MRLISDTLSDIHLHRFSDEVEAVTVDSIEKNVIKFSFWCRDVKAKSNRSVIVSRDPIKRKRVFNYSCRLRLQMSLHDDFIFEDPTISGVEFSVEDDAIYSTSNYSVSNTYYGGSICWGLRYSPDSSNLSSFLDLFKGLTFNNDLTPYGIFYDGMISAKKQSKKKTKEKVFCANYDGFVVVSFKQHPISYFRFRAAGYPDIGGKRQIMLLPVKKKTITVDGASYSGYLTPNDALNKKWFITNLSGPKQSLVGQVDG